MSNEPALPQPVRSRTRRRRLQLVALSLLLTFGLCELVARAGLALLEWDQLSAFDSNGGSASEEIETGEVLHPYFGVAFNPDTHTGIDYRGRRVKINSLGIPGGDVEPVQRRGSDRFIVGILGGSFAWQFSVVGAKRFEQILERHPALRNRDVVVVSLAVPTFKQPQQVMLLNYVMSLGGQFDAVVNLDGFNEVALAAETNRMSTFYAYPQMWPYRTAGSLDPRVQSQVYQMRDLRARRRHYIAIATQSWWSVSALARLYCRLQAQRLTHKLADLDGRIHRHVADVGYGYEQSGPFVPELTPADLYPRCATLWRRSSLQLRSVVEGQHGVYLHALQPNQYVLGSKPLAPEELESAFEEETIYCRAVRAGYPLLRAEAETLRRRGVHFADLTDVFRDHPEPLYVDDCCHSSEPGYQIVAERLADELLQCLEQPDER